MDFMMKGQREQYKMTAQLQLKNVTLSRKRQIRPQKAWRPTTTTHAEKELRVNPDSTGSMLPSYLGP